MKMIKTAFIGVMPIGFLTFWIAPGNATEVEIKFKLGSLFPTDEWCAESIGPFPEEGQPGITEWKVHHPGNIDRYLTINKVAGGLRVFNAGIGDLSYVAHDLTEGTYSGSLHIRPKEEQLWTTENPCTIYLGKLSKSECGLL